MSKTRMSFRVIRDRATLALFRAETATRIQVELPMEYLERAAVVALVSADGKTIRGGFAIAGAGGIRALEQLPDGYVANHPYLRTRLDRCFEVNAFWLDRREVRTSACFFLYVQCFLRILGQAFRGRTHFVYAFDANHHRLEKMFAAFHPVRIFHGEVKALPGMKGTAVEVVEVCSIPRLLFSALRNPLFILRRMRPRKGRREAPALPDDTSLRALVAELAPYAKVSRAHFYGDLSVTALLAWGSLLALSLRPWDIWSPLLLLVSYLAFYRGNAFIHEVVHFGKKVKGIGALYNLAFGFPDRIPYYIHEPHKYHHLPNTFGTAKDPEYLYLKGKGAAYFLRPLYAAPLAPLLLLVRFGLLPLVSWAFPKSWRMAIYQKLSTIVVNPAYVRPEGRPADIRRAAVQDLGCAAYVVAFAALWWAGILNGAFFAWWYLIAVVATAVNMYRARVAHLYDGDGRVLTDLEALRDSTTIEGSLWSELWAPLGLKYHALHHLAPQIPYHGLGPAHRHLRSRLSPRHPYSRTMLPSLRSGLRQYRGILRGVDAQT